MPPEPPTTRNAPPDALEFEITDFTDARQALDELPAGVALVPTLAPNYWQRRRREALPTDRALAGPTIDWMLRLPPELRPRALCEHYPRIANTIAAAWRSDLERAAVLDSLLTDRRGQRRGLPEQVRGEIEALLNAARGRGPG